jgi:hypothetical protein
MQYYTFKLDDDSKDLCIISTPFGQYHCNHLAMGLKVSPDIAQEIMEDLLHDTSILMMSALLMTLGNCICKPLIISSNIYKTTTLQLTL